MENSIKILQNELLNRIEDIRGLTFDESMEKRYIIDGLEIAINLLKDNQN